MSFLRRVAGRSLRDRVRSSVTREELRVEPLLLHIERGQLRWLGHLFRMPPGRLPGKVFRARPTGRRPRGRPRTRWRDYVSRLAWERLGVPPEELEEVSREREVWASLLRLLPPRSGPGQAEDDGWRDGWFRAILGWSPPSPMSSGTIQNALINAIAEVMGEEIKREIKKAPFVAVMVDETTDASNAAQLALVLHYVTDTGVKERFVRFEDVTSGKRADDIAALISNGSRGLELRTTVLEYPQRIEARVQMKTERRVRKPHEKTLGRANQSSEAQWQGIHHSPQGIRTPDEAQPSTEPPTDMSPEPIQPQTAVERKISGRKPKILWPKACQKKEWETTDTDLVHLLEGLKGCVERKLDKIEEIINSYGEVRFGVKSTTPNLGTQKNPSVKLKSRRQQEIERLVKERRNLRKQWRKATEVERKGLEALQGDIKQRIATLRRAECLRKQHKKERTRTAFYRDPYKFVKDLFAKEKTGTLKVPLRELEKHLRKTYSDNQRHVPASIPDDMPPIQPPKHQLEVRPPTWSEVESTVKRARTASAPGPNGVP
ncbi:hypothetical protein PO909_022108 [Leuciscus waleckii]